MYSVHLCLFLLWASDEYLYGDGGPLDLGPLRLGLGALWHGWMPAELTGTSPQLPLASAPWLLGDPLSWALLSSFQESGTVAPLMVLLGLSRSGGL